MCTTCGCSTSEAAVRVDGKAGGVHEHPHEDHHHHHHDHDDHGHHHTKRTIDLEAGLLAKNDHLAAENRAWFGRREITAINLIGAPGAGKTALLEATIARLGASVTIAVIEGDQETDHDARRIRSTGRPVVQVNTGAGCHLDAHMLVHALEALKPESHSLLLIENVGNLVCPALFDLGERAKVVVMSVTEGEDKPEKYPHIFRAADALVLTKTDLLPHLDFDRDACVSAARRVNPRIEVFQVSSRKGLGVSLWCDWLQGQRTVRRPFAAET